MPHCNIRGLRVRLSNAFLQAAESQGFRYNHASKVVKAVLRRERSFEGK